MKTKKTINELPYAWRLAGMDALGNAEYVEIDIHARNFRPSTKASESSHYAKIMWANEYRYIRFRGETWVIV